MAGLWFIPAGRVCMRPGPLYQAVHWLIAPAGGALVWLALYIRPISLLSNTGHRRSATARDLARQEKKRNRS
ncbi:hypothetical protein DPMN_022943 [Dreissena polymorpha]|uniref:Uncharacterized protein n=1 Tax=Dreissena polymorpha TaxID=45954 RepID=A0A9D4LL65_DREPO|nr:hypothetical protein DPMN_022943 [Dreissena polymorpha]